MKSVCHHLWICIVVFLVIGLENRIHADPNSSVRRAPERLTPGDHQVGKMIPNLKLRDIEGESFRLSDYQNKKGLVVSISSTTCPMSKKFAPSLARLEAQYSAKDVAFLFLNVNSAEEISEIQKFRKQHGFISRFVHNPDSRLAVELGAGTSTEVFVMDGARTLVYRGAISDQYGLGYSRKAPRKEYLVNALDELLEGRPITMSATTAPGCDLDLGKKETIMREVTYHDRISRIVQNHCQECHRSGGVAPFTLTSYKDLVGHRGMIRKVVRDEIMPPWFASPPAHNVVSPWQNDRTLSKEEKADLLTWIQNGYPEGTEEDAPIPRKFHSEWAIGEPDLILSIPEPIEIPAEGVMPYQYQQTDSTLKEDTWIQAIQIKPTARESLHHVLVFVRNPKHGRKRNRNSDPLNDSFFGVYVPGNEYVIYPNDMGRFIPAGSQISFQLHYTPSGTQTIDQTQVGLVFCKDKPKHRVRVEAIANSKFKIPPFAENYQANAHIDMPAGVSILGFFPHMHLRGKAFRYDLISRDENRKSVTTLLDIPQYDFNWQLFYRYATPLRLSESKKLEVIGWWDNSENNPANPDPSKTVRWGDQTFEEMMIGYVEYFVNEPTE
ncbi:MAG TPA: redoxin domain-containing protein [Verrucomicrobiales bacterium]|nr:redoxin domain-containing protein [Verrucomicrobiales bacterium]HIL70605.1 redoxin domain-containing protein [Verrucomicrobiota bacterium]